MHRLLAAVGALVASLLLFAVLVVPGSESTPPAAGQAESGSAFRLVAAALAKNAPAGDPDETALARSLLLTRADFDGWSEVSADDIVRIDRCEPDAPAAVTGEAVSDSYANLDTGSGGYQHLRVYASAGAAAGFEADFSDSVDCLVSEIEGGGVETNDLELRSAAVALVDVASPGDGVAITAYRISGEARATVSGLTVEFDYAWDVIIAVQGRVAYTLHLQGIGGPVDANLRASLLATATARIAAANVN